MLEKVEWVKTLEFDSTSCARTFGLISFSWLSIDIKLGSTLIRPMFSTPASGADPRGPARQVHLSRRLRPSLGSSRKALPGETAYLSARGTTSFFAASVSLLLEPCLGRVAGLRPFAAKVNGAVGLHWVTAAFNSLSILKGIGVCMLSNYLSPNVAFNPREAKLLKTSDILTPLHGLSGPPE